MVVWLLIRHLHVKKFHQGVGCMRAAVSLKYVVLNWRCLLQIIENSCITLGYKQPPFPNTSVDYFVPFLVPIGRSTEKRRFFCLSISPLEQYTLKYFPLSTQALVLWAWRSLIHGVGFQLPSCPTTA